MRVFAHGLLAGVLAAVVGGSSAAQTDQKKDAAAVLAAARQALGGEKKLSAVKSFTTTGRTRQVRGENLVPIEFEVSVELPDKYLRKDEIPAQETGATASGFNGDDLLIDPAPPAPMPDPMRKARVTTLKQDFARLALGMFAGSFPAYPLTFTYVGEAEAPQGKADVIDAKGPDNVTLRLFISSDTHLPIMVSWQPPAGRGMPPGAAGMRPPAGAGRGTPPPAGAPPPGAPPSGTPPSGAPPSASGFPGAPPPRPVELRVYFADYRDVDGLQLPFRIRRATGPDTTEETTVDRYRLNAKIDPKKFEVRK
jgi:hypothetical protein